MADIYDLEGFLAEQGINYTPYREPKTPSPGLFDVAPSRNVNPNSAGLLDTEMAERIRNYDPGAGLLESLRTPSSELISKRESATQMDEPAAPAPRGSIRPDILPLITATTPPAPVVDTADLVRAEKTKPAAPAPRVQIPQMDPSLDITVERAKELESEIPESVKKQMEEAPPEEKSNIYRDYLTKLVEAQDSASDKRLIANLGRAGETASAIMTGRQAQTGLYDSILDQANAEEQDVLKQLKLSQAEEEKDRELALRDANSEDSKTARDLVKGILPEFANKIPNFENMSVEDLDKAMPFLNLRRQLDAQKEQAEIRRLTQERLMQKDEEMQKQKTMEENRRVSKVINDEAQRLGRSDPVIRKVREQNATFDELGPILEASRQGNEAAIAALGTRLARAMGEVGVLTDQDVVRYLGNTSWARQLSSWLKKGAVGQLPEGQLEDLQNMVGMMQDVYTDKVGSQFDQAASILVERYPVYLDQETGERVPMTIDQARSLVGHPLYAGSEELRNARQQQIREEFGLKPIERGQVRRKTKDGRTAIFDAETKEFVRFEDE